MPEPYRIGLMALATSAGALACDIPTEIPRWDTRWDVVVDLRRSAVSYGLLAGERLIPRKPAEEIHRVRLLGELAGRPDDPPARGRVRR